MAQNVVPFGKYKGQPVEAMAADRGYVDWLLAQDWFKDRHQNIYTLIINNFAEASETPEHNALQALFLDPVFAEQVIAVHHIKMLRRGLWQQVMDDAQPAAPIARVNFEIRGADVHVEFGGEEFRIEIKPSVGDDYPAILRQIRNIKCTGSPILFFDRYTGSGATREQVIDIFDKSGIKLVSRAEATRRRQPDYSSIIGMCNKVKDYKELFEERWKSEWYEARTNLAYVDRALVNALDEQNWFFREAVVAGDNEQIFIHGEAMARGWQAANRRMEEAEIAKAKAVFPGATVTGVREKKIG